MFINNDTNEIILHHALEKALGKRLVVPVNPDQLEGTNYSVFRRTIPDCDASAHIAVQNGFERIGAHEVVQQWSIRPKTAEELALDAEMMAMKLGN